MYEKEKKNDLKDQDDNDRQRNENKNDNKFIEFIAINPGVIKSEYQVFPNAKEELKYELSLKKDFRDKINKISELDLSLFPKNGDLNAKKIERILRFQKLVKEWKEIEMSIGPKSTNDEKTENTIKESNEENDIKPENIDNIKEVLNLKDKSYSNIDENENENDNEEEEFDMTPKNIESNNSKNSQNTSNKYDKNHILNLNDGNSFSSEKS